MNSECLRSIFHAVCALLVKSLYLLPRKNLFPVLCALLGTSCSPNTVTDNNFLESAQRYCHKPLCEPHSLLPQKSPGSSEVLSTRREEKVLHCAFPAARHLPNHDLVRTNELFTPKQQLSGLQVAKAPVLCGALLRGSQRAASCSAPRAPPTGHA